VAGEKNENKIVLRVEAIETPRGLVPSIEAIKGIVSMVNRVLSEIFEGIQGIISLLRENTEMMKDILGALRTVSVKLDVIQEIVTEIKVSVGGKRGERIISTRESKKDIKKELLDMIRSDR